MGPMLLEQLPVATRGAASESSEHLALAARRWGSVAPDAVTAPRPRVVLRDRSGPLCAWGSSSHHSVMWEAVPSFPRQDKFLTSHAPSSHFMSLSS